MVKRGRGGKCMGGGINSREPCQKMDSCRKELTTAEDIVDDLRSKYNNYARTKRQVLLLNVRHVLNDRDNKRRRDEEEDDNNGDEEFAAKKKKQRRVDEDEEKLQQAEQSHLRRRNMERSVSSEVEESGGVSTSEDAIYSEKLSPRFDLFNDSLRDNYAKLNSPSKKPIRLEKNVEV